MGGVFCDVGFRGEGAVEVLAFVVAVVVEVVVVVVIGVEEF